MKGQDSNSDFEKLLVYLKQTRGFDFSAYKRSTLQRRVLKRMAMIGVTSFGEYLDYLEVQQNEFQDLFNTILINVTSFFRDEEAWTYLNEEIIPKLVRDKDSEMPVRVWVAGCASGQEAYTMAMLLSEAVGSNEFRERVKVYATDVDEDALNQARQAVYSAKDVETVPPKLLEKYFEQNNDKYMFDRELRRSMIFGRHDLIQDAPISRVDLLLCRNTLMYFNAETQERILARFHFALHDGGFLYLGKAETLLTHTSIFQPLDLKNRIFSKVPRSRVRDRTFMFNGPGSGIKPPVEANGRLQEAALDAIPFALIVLDSTGRLAHINERARTLFNLALRDLGRPIQDLEVSYRPVELRSSIEQAYSQCRAINHKDVNFILPTGEAVVLDLRVAPVIDESVDPIGISITAEDVTGFKRLQEELLNFNQELETAYEEVQSTNEELQTTNEELQSTVEELETTNEELQSTNEELETMNEELQSTNEELETINEELRQRSNELNEANSFLQSILGSLQDGVVVVDRNLEVLAWNHRSEDLWGLRSDEVSGKHLLNLDFGFPVEQLLHQIRASVNGTQSDPISVEATNRRGRRMTCSTICTPLIGLGQEPRGAIILTQCVPQN